MVFIWYQLYSCLHRFWSYFFYTFTFSKSKITTLWMYYMIAHNVLKPYCIILIQDNVFWVVCTTVIKTYKNLLIIWVVPAWPKHLKGERGWQATTNSNSNKFYYYHISFFQGNRELHIIWILCFYNLFFEFAYSRFWLPLFYLFSLNCESL